MEAFDTYDHAGCTISLFQDYYAGNPYTEWDQASEILSDVKDYDLGGSVPHPESVYAETPSSAVMARYLTLFGGYAVAIPWSFQDYGSSGARAFLYAPDDADIADGWLVVSRETVAREWGNVEDAEKCARSEFAAFAAWIEGDVCGYVVESASGEHVDSCFGFYGETDYVRKQAEESAEAYAEEFAKLRALPWLPTFGNPILSAV